VGLGPGASEAIGSLGRLIVLKGGKDMVYNKSKAWDRPLKREIEYLLEDVRRFLPEDSIINQYLVARIDNILFKIQKKEELP